MHSLATTSGPARKVGVVSIIKMAAREQTLLNIFSSKIEELSKELFKVAARLEELLKARIMYIKWRIGQ